MNTQSSARASKCQAQSKDWITMIENEQMDKWMNVQKCKCILWMIALIECQKSFDENCILAYGPQLNE